MLQNLEKAPDATVFLSTAALLVGIFLTATAAILGATLPGDPAGITDPDLADASVLYQRSLQRTLFMLVIINTAGTVLPLIVLFAESIGPLDAAWIFVVLASSIVAVLANMAALSALYLSPALARRMRRE